MTVAGFACRDEDGLVLEPRGPALARRPPFVVEAARDHVLRLSVAGVPVLWARIEAYREDVAFLDADREGTLAIVPPITMPQLRRIDAEPGTAAWWGAWERWFALALVSSPRSPLYSCIWRIDRPSSLAERHLPSPRWAAAALSAAPCRFELGALRIEGTGGLLALRRRSPPGSGRVASWRKRARDGVCPPVLVAYLDVLGKHAVLDGHDRLQACALEGVEPPCLVLWPERRFPTAYQERDRCSIGEAAGRLLDADPTPPQALVESVNRWLIPAFTPWRSEPRTRAFPLTGGVARWTTEVERRLSELGCGADREAAEALLATWG